MDNVPKAQPGKSRSLSRIKKTKKWASSNLQKRKKGKNKVDKVWIGRSRIQKKNDIQLKKRLMNIDLMNIE